MPAVQAAQHYARVSLDVDAIDGLQPRSVDRRGDGIVEVRLADGADEVRVVVREGVSPPIERLTCGADGADDDPHLGAARPRESPHLDPYDGAVPPRVTVVGSINLDLVVQVERLPERGETVGGGTFARVPGGKGANQAVACARLGAEVTMVAAVGRDPFADEALAGLREAGVTLVLSEVDEPTGVALIQVDATGETTIAVAPGANATLGAVELPAHDAVLCQLEVPDEAVLAAWEACTGLFCLNAAPARPIAVDADLTVVNRLELDALTRRDGLVALTLGAEGAVLLEDEEEIARAAPPPVERGRRHRRGRRLHRLPARLAARGARGGGGAPSRLRRGRARRVALRRAAVAPDRRRGRRDPRSVERRRTSACVAATQALSGCGRARRGR